MPQGRSDECFIHDSIVPSLWKDTQLPFTQSWINDREDMIDQQTPNYADICDSGQGVCKKR